MACYSWQGITLQGKLVTGTSIAPTLADLDRLLLDQEIALLHSRSIVVRKAKNLTLQELGQWTKQMSELTGAGLRIDQAITILAMHINDKNKLWFLDSLLMQVQQGATLQDALARHIKIIDPMMISFITMGHESGNMAAGLRHMSDYIEQKNASLNSIKSIALTPLITFSFFIMVCLAIFIFLVPMFGSLFTSLNQPVPTVTNILLGISDYLRSFKWIIPAAITAIGMLLLYIGAKKFYAPQLDKKIIRVPVIGWIIKNQKISHIWLSVGLLLQKGVTQLQALKLCKSVEGNKYLGAQLDTIVDLVEQGTRLSVAIQSTHEFNNATAVGLLQVGEESGQLGSMALQVSSMYRQAGVQSMNTVTKLIGPALMLVMGILVTFLAVSVYIPLLNVAQAL